MDAVNAIATVTAIFKKDPWCLIAHPNSAIKILADLMFYSVKLKVFLTISKFKPLYDTLFASVKNPNN
ncbi:hypothetical protein [Nostoc sp.]|uniref:hypothetical protein n=1 Tax=Nostoc sp. TaxID=1180 RepID=UPI002FF9BC92